MTDRGAELTECEGAGCERFLVEQFAEKQIDAYVTTEPPIVSDVFQPFIVRCPHGVRYFAAPTGEQRAEWVRTEMP